MLRSGVLRLAGCCSTQCSRRASTFTVLGIETSCDDTGVAVVRSDGTVLGEARGNQDHIHEPWGGIVPRLAAEAHRAEIDGVIQAALDEAEVDLADIDVVAATTGPGLALCLKIGLVAARSIVAEHRKPFVAVNHLEAHLLTARMPQPEDSTYSQPQFPFIGMLVSGGHTQIVAVRGIGRYELMGETLDDAAGEAFDKVARMLQLNGGAALSEAAKNGNIKAVPLKLPLLKGPRSERVPRFSFSGLKTAVQRAVQNGDYALEDVAASFQYTATRHIALQLQLALTQSDEQFTCVVLSGGCAANQALRQELSEVATQFRLDLVVPPPELCTDNGVMIGWAGVERYQLGLSNCAIDEDIRPRWPCRED